ncbi:MAG: RodZ domain-containing protein [Burkholderiaceae bacterium]
MALADVLERPSREEVNSTVRSLTLVSTPAELSAAREAVGMTWQQISDRLRIDTSRLAALEGGNWEALPSRAFARASLRSVARILGVDATALIESIGGFGQAGELRSGLRPQVAIPVATASMMGSNAQRTQGARSPWRRLAWSVAGLGVAVFGLLGVWAALDIDNTAVGSSRMVQVPVPGASQPVAMTGSVFTSNGSDGKPTTSAQPLPVSTSTIPMGRPAIRSTQVPGKSVAAGKNPATSVGLATVAATAVGSTEAAPLTFPVKLPPTESVEIQFLKPSWVDIRHKDGEKLLYGTQKGKKKVVLSGVPPMQVVIGNPDGVKMRFRGEPVDLKAATRKGVTRLVLN